MANNLAMYVRPPSIDLGATMARAEALKGAQQDNQLGALKLQEATGTTNALNNYRSAAQAGDPNAMGALTGYPDLQATVSDSIAHMNENERREAIGRGQEIGRAAYSVMNFPVGSPERKAEWNKQLDGLKKKGLLSADQYNEYHDNPSDLVLHNAAALGRTYDQLAADHDLQQQRQANDAARNILLGTAPATIKTEEGFSGTAAWDKNAYRAGYGSDTVTHADGTVEKVTKDTVVTQADAERDLQRRLPEFASTAAGQVGTATWAGFDDKTQAALSSVAYNYGSLPDSVRDAARSGDKERIAKAVESLTTNPERRAREATMIRGQEPTAASTGTQPNYRDRLLTVASDTTIDEHLRELATKLLGDEKKVPRTYEDMTPEQKLNVEDAARKQVEAGQSKYAMDNVAPEELQKQIDAARAEILKQLFGAAGAGAGGKLDASQAANDPAAANAAKPTTQEEFDALPVGAPFINPKDGKLLYKKAG